MVRVHWPDKSTTSDGLLPSQRQGVHDLFARFVAEFEPTRMGYRSRERQLADGTRVRIMNIGDLDFVDVWPVGQPTEPPLAGIGILFTTLAGLAVEGWRKETSPGVFVPVPALVMSGGEGRWRAIRLEEMIGGHLLWRRPASYRWIGASIAGPFCTRMNLTVRAMHVPSAIAPPFVAESSVGRRLYHISPSSGSAVVWSGPAAALFGLQDKVTLDTGDYIGPITYSLTLPLPLLADRRLAIHPEGTSAVAVGDDKDTLVRFVFDPASTGTFSVEADITGVLTPTADEVVASGVKTVTVAGGCQLQPVVCQGYYVRGIPPTTEVFSRTLNLMARWEETKTSLTYLADTDKNELYGIHMDLDGSEVQEVLGTTKFLTYSGGNSVRIEEGVRDFGPNVQIDVMSIYSSFKVRPPTKLTTTDENTQRWDQTTTEEINFGWGTFARLEERLYLHETVKRVSAEQFKAVPPLPDMGGSPHILFIFSSSTLTFFTSVSGEATIPCDLTGAYEMYSVRHFEAEELVESASAEYSGRIDRTTRTLLWHDPEMRFTASVDVAIGHAINGTQDLGTDPEMLWPPAIGDLSAYITETQRTVKLVLRQDGVEVFSADIPPFATKATMRERATRVLPTYTLTEESEEKWTTKFADLTTTTGAWGPTGPDAHYILSLSPSAADGSYNASGGAGGIDHYSTPSLPGFDDAVYFHKWYGAPYSTQPLFAIRPNQTTPDTFGRPVDERVPVEIPLGRAILKAQIGDLHTAINDPVGPPSHYNLLGPTSWLPSSTMAYQTYEQTDTYEVHSPPSSPATIPLPFDTARDEVADPVDPVLLFTAKAAKDPISGGIVIHIDFDGSEYQGGATGDKSWTFAVSTLGVTPLQKVLGIPLTTQLKLKDNATTSLVSI